MLIRGSSLGFAQAVSAEEVKKAVCSIPLDKAAGPDGFTARFFRVVWDKIGPLIYDVVAEFFASGKLLKSINSTP